MATEVDGTPATPEDGAAATEAVERAVATAVDGAAMVAVLVVLPPSESASVPGFFKTWCQSLQSSVPRLVALAAGCSSSAILGVSTSSRGTPQIPPCRGTLQFSQMSWDSSGAVGDWSSLLHCSLTPTVMPGMPQRCVTAQASFMLL